MVANQITNIIRFFLSKNLRIARDRAWDQTVYSRGKGPDFWRPYVEEFNVPPKVRQGSIWERAAGNAFGRLLIQRGSFVYFLSIASQHDSNPASAIISAESISCHWHRTSCLSQGCRHCPLSPYPREFSSTYSAVRTKAFSQYFEAKKMTKEQIALFMEERKWNYQGSLPNSLQIDY